MPCLSQATDDGSDVRSARALTNTGALSWYRMNSSLGWCSAFRRAPDNAQRLSLAQLRPPFAQPIRADLFGKADHREALLTALGRCQAPRDLDLAQIKFCDGTGDQGGQVRLAIRGLVKGFGSCSAHIGHSTPNIHLCLAPRANPPTGPQSLLHVIKILVHDPEAHRLVESSGLACSSPRSRRRSGSSRPPAAGAGTPAAPRASSPAGGKPAAR